MAAVSAFLLVNSAAAQNSTAFDIGQVLAADKNAWCISQRNVCSDLCKPDGFDKNRCTAQDLSIECVCSGGEVPDLAAYQNSVPFYICQATTAQCIASNQMDAQAQQKCRDDNQCGSKNATEFGEASTTTAAASTTAASTTAAATAASASPTNAALRVGAEWGTGLLAVGIAGAFGALL
ncbi:MAG: hypothetical protein M1825_005193 [Sarcosagium campestre]|nr:MAG: hypothetical protein M1825_005193 [Sarcosagium campestre]